MPVAHDSVVAGSRNGRWSWWWATPLVATSVQIVVGAEQLREGYYDCTEDDSVTQHAVRRAYRQLALGHHPDKGGSGEVAADLAALRDAWLRDPLRFHVFRAMFEAVSLHPLHGVGVETSRVKAADARVIWREGWPYLEIEVDLEHGGRIANGGSWTLAFGLKGVSTIHYHGDENAGGYDVCCDFQMGSQCLRRPLAHTGTGVADDGEEACAVDRGRCSHATGGGGYLKSDCPLPHRFTILVRRPLHLNTTGQWGAALQVSDALGQKLVCVALAFAHPDRDDSKDAPLEVEEGAAGPAGRAPELEGTELLRSGSGAGREEQSSFRHHRTGEFCEDGGDLLEGLVDDYGALSPFGGARRADIESSLFYGSRCREKCRKRRQCRFYTVFSNGWCQLSSRCGRTSRSGDPLTVTFGKMP